MAGFLVSGAQIGLQQGLDKLGADVIVIPYDPYAKNYGFFMTGQPSDTYFSDSMVNEVLSTPGIARTTGEAYVGRLPNVTWCPYYVNMIGFDPSSDFVMSSLVSKGTASMTDHWQAMVGYLTTANIGSTIDILGHSFTVVGRIGETRYSTDNSVFISLDDAYTLAAESKSTSSPLPLNHGEISAVLVKTDRTLPVDSVTYWVTISNPGVLAFPMSALNQGVAAQLDTTTQMLYVTIVVVILVSMPLIALISTMGASERRREVGLMRAMGATQSYVFRLFFSEAVVLGFIGGVVGVLGASLFLGVFQEAISSSLDMTILWPPLADAVIGVGLALLAVVILAGVAAMWPAFKASRLEPYDAIRRGQN
jgi:putative ABC transport system permease protein